MTTETAPPKHKDGPKFYAVIGAALRQRGDNEAKAWRDVDEPSRARPKGMP